jgi:hypothetical protein
VFSARAGRLEASIQHNAVHGHFSNPSEWLNMTPIGVSWPFFFFWKATEKGQYASTKLLSLNSLLELVV